MWSVHAVPLQRNTHQKPSQGNESGTFQTCMRDTSSYLRRTAHCGLLQLLEANSMTIPRLCHYSFLKLLPHPSLTNHSIVRHYKECSAWGMPNIRLIYESFWVKKCCINISDYRPLHGYKHFNVSRYCMTLYAIGYS
jgi:hypothetical protein